MDDFQQFKIDDALNKLNHYLQMIFEKVNDFQRKKQLIKEYANYTSSMKIVKKCQEIEKGLTNEQTKQKYLILLILLTGIPLKKQHFIKNLLFSLDKCLELKFFGAAYRIIEELFINGHDVDNRKIEMCQKIPNQNGLIPNITCRNCNKQFPFQFNKCAHCHKTSPFCSLTLEIIGVKSQIFSCNLCESKFSKMVNSSICPICLYGEII